MKRYLLPAFALCLCFQFPLQGREVVLAEPATHFTESLPLGNGRLGAMLFGGVDAEKIVLNENGMWSGSPQNADRPGAAEALPEIRQLLLEGKNAEAEALVNKHFTCAGKGSGGGVGANVPFGCYQTLGQMYLEFTYPSEAPVEDYRRWLDLETATAHLSFLRDGVEYRREGFVSKPGEVFVYRVTASKEASLHFNLRLDRQERRSSEVHDNGDLEMYGELNNGWRDGRGVRYATRVRVAATDGTVEIKDGVISVSNASEVVLHLSAATDIKTFAGRGVNDARATARSDLDAQAEATYWGLRADHIADYRAFFSRTTLQLGSSPAAAEMIPPTTPGRLQRFAAGEPDPDLAALYFDFGRYLLISSSRPGGLPANLQGIWAEKIQTPWNGDWHLNINLQMNYWPANICNLEELNEPLFALIESLQEPGAITAQTYYGARGWVSFLLANPWGFTSPGESASWGSTVSCSAWLCQHLWDHYLFTGDKAFLERAYPIMRGAALFYLDMLIEEPAHGWLVTAPSNSPENAFLLPDGTKAHVCMGPTADQQLLRYLFDACIEASVVLGEDHELRQELREKRDRLAPTRLGPDGRIMEWLEPYEEADPQHRHIAHLWGLYPGNEISPDRTPALANGARASLNGRGDGGTGWSLAFKLAMWARLGDGERAHKILTSHLKPADQKTAKQRWSGGTYANLFDAHPPFQIDGNLGGSAAIAEMLLQSHLDSVKLLPALPPQWPDGTVSGLRARGGLEVSISWSKGELTEVTLVSEKGGEFTLQYGEARIPVSLQELEQSTLSVDDFR
ncbi:MAG: glycoside hydrolase N-terminal domain-containing protein [Puniceicoccaceae bacterium]